jgi:hypothetical protein
VGPFTRLNAIWSVLCGSLVIDPLLALYQPATISSDVALTVVIFAAIILVPCIAQESLFKGIAALRALNAKQLERHTRLIPLLIGVGVASVVVLKALSLSNLSGTWGIALIALMLIATVRSVVATVQKTISHTEALKTDLWSRLIQWESQLVALSLAPLLLARGISLVGALSTSALVSTAYFPFLFATSALYLAMLRPTKNLFVGLCKRCKHPVPIVFLDLGGCINCDERLQQALYRAQENARPAPSKK